MSETLQLSTSLTVSIMIPPSRMLSFLCSAADKLWRVRLFHSGRFRSTELTNHSTVQNPFTVMLSPVTVATAEEMGLRHTVNSYRIESSFRATAGTHSSPTHPR